MKRIFLFLFIFLVATDALYCIVIQPQPALREAVRLPTLNELATAGKQIAESRIVRQIVSGDWLRPQPLDPIALVPEEAVLMLDTANAAAAGRAFLSSRFGQTLYSVRWSAVLDQLEVPKIFRLPVEQQLANLTTLLANPLLQDILKRRTVIALLAPPPPTAASLQGILEHSLLLTASTQGNSTAAVLSLLKATEKQVDVVYHQGVGILVLEQQGRKLHVAAIGGQLAFSFGIKPVQRSIDLFVRHFVYKQTGLLRNQDYAELKQQAQGQDDFFLYADIIRLKALLAPTETNLSPALDNPTGSRSMALFHHQGEKRQQFSAAVRFSPEQLLPFQREIYTSTPVLNRTLAKMPASLLLYFWIGWLEPNFWYQTLVNSGKQDVVDKADVWFNEQTGMTFAEILSLFGREFSVNIAEISTAGLFPIPRLCFIMEVQEKKKAERLLAKLISGLQVKREKMSGGVTVVSLQAAQGLLQPSYAVVDGFLYMADSREQLLDILDGKSERMIENSTFQAVDTGMGQPANLMFFVRTAQLVDGLKELVAWVGTMIAVRDEQAGAKSKILVDQVIMPILDSFRGCETVALRSVTRSGELIVEASAFQAEEKQEQTAALQTEEQ
ncbi:MAG: hypothetical protein CDV28_1192 [Candidatus Electronema aureum]|uniref:DUF3352 domain-containing protein n=1 Tax=Candidatus Electronema aureum TaxID=2005002 RepID=A0A521G0Y0_9BACT|nr:MAG: hypothetical protein CDV28_1192 [Candidatus Electronema aureum]